jgi:hypothetical protein
VSLAWSGVRLRSAPPSVVPLAAAAGHSSITTARIDAPLSEHNERRSGRCGNQQHHGVAPLPSQGARHPCLVNLDGSWLRVDCDATGMVAWPSWPSRALRRSDSGYTRANRLASC